MIRIDKATPEAQCEYWVTLSIKQQMPNAYWLAWCQETITASGTHWQGNWKPDDGHKGKHLNPDGTRKKPRDPEAPNPGASVEIPGMIGNAWVYASTYRGGLRLTLELREPLPIGEYCIRLQEYPSKYSGTYLGGFIVKAVPMPRGATPTAETMAMAQTVANITEAPVAVAQQTIQPVGSETAQLERIAELEAHIAARDAEVAKANQEAVNPLFKKQEAEAAVTRHPDSTDHPF